MINRGNAMKSQFATIKSALDDLKAGKLIIVVDDEDRENEGDFIGASQFATAQGVNFMAKHGRGLICIALPRERIEELKLRPMVERSTAHLGTAFTESVDYKHGTTTGISAHDRAKTIKALIDPHAKADDFARPGHIFPLIAANGGVLKRAGHTEAAVDLANLAKLYPSGVICEIMDEDGTMARLPKLTEVAKQFGLKIITIADLIEYRRRTEKLIERLAHAKLPTRWGNFDIVLYEDILTDMEHIALVKGEVAGKKNVLVRVHSECMTGDFLGSLRCDCGDQLHSALRQIETAGQGVLLYMRQEGRGIGLAEKIKAYHLQDLGFDTVEANCRLGHDADLRDYGIGAQILADIGLTTIRLLTNNPKKIIGLEGYGLEIIEQIPIIAEPNPFNIQYLRTKRDKLGHKIPEEKLTISEKKKKSGA